MHDLATLDTLTVFSCTSQKSQKQDDLFVPSMTYYNAACFEIYEASLRYAAQYIYD